jgi:hypothetical protein
MSLCRNAATVRIASHSALMAMRQTRVLRAYDLDKSHLSRGSAYRARRARSMARNMPIHATIPVCVNTRVCYLITFIPLVLKSSLDKSLVLFSHFHLIRNILVPIVSRTMPRKPLPKLPRASGEPSLSHQALPLSTILNCASCISTSVRHSQCEYRVHNMAQEGAGMQEAIRLERDNCV